MHPVHSPHSSRRAQALIEVMVAVSILTVGFLGIITLLSRALSLNRVVADNYVGTYLAAEGIELAKNIIDANLLQGRAWNAGLSDGDFEADFESTELTPQCGNPLRYSPATNLYGYSGSTPTTYRRCISIVLVDQQHIKVNSEVTWLTRGGGTSRVDLEDHFYNWR